VRTSDYMHVLLQPPCAYIHMCICVCLHAHLVPIYAPCAYIHMCVPMYTPCAYVHTLCLCIYVCVPIYTRLWPAFVNVRAQPLC